MEDALTRKRFLWGLILTWAPWVPAMIGLSSLFIGISHSKATGVAAVAASMVELLVLWGVGTLLISQIAAIVWLFRSFSGAHVLRNVIAAASLVASALMLLLVCAFLFWGQHLLFYTPFSTHFFGEPIKPQ